MSIFQLIYSRPCHSQYYITPTYSERQPQYAKFKCYNSDICYTVQKCHTILEKDKLPKENLEKFNKDLIYKKDIKFIRDKMAFNGR